MIDKSSRTLIMGDFNADVIKEKRDSIQPLAATLCQVVTPVRFVPYCRTIRLYIISLPWWTVSQNA